MKRKYINPISNKRKGDYLEYINLISRLAGLCGNKSELTGNPPDWQTDYHVEPHHINGRTGKLYLDPFNIIMLTRNEHRIEEGEDKNHLPHDKEYLLGIVRDKRVAQGYKEG